MLSARLVKTIEDHAEDLTREVLQDLASNPRTPAYHAVSGDELHRRVYDVYHNLGRWIGEPSHDHIDRTYQDLGRRRRGESVPLSQVIWALTRIKRHLFTYIQSRGLVSSAVELYQEEELNLLVEQFFDQAVYSTIRGYEST